MTSAAKGNLRLDGHAGLEHAVLVVDRHLHAVHELRPLVRRLHVARREFGLLRDVADRSGDARAGSVGKELAELIALTEKSENLNVKRLKYLSEIAGIRNKSLRDVMKELEIFAPQTI